ncbi:MAG: hypothetical protein JO131_00470 [Gammaproteobacteria bacterium]|nr:hypothetical protein [Gammaproteobacteria bacterium]
MHQNKIFLHVNKIILFLIITISSSMVFAETQTTVHVVNNLTRVGIFVTIPTKGVYPSVGPVAAHAQSSFGPYFLSKTQPFTVFDTREIYTGFGKCTYQDKFVGSDVTVIIDQEQRVDKNFEIICSVKSGLP